MKKILFISLAIFVIAWPSFAQISKNRVSLGLSFNPNHSEIIYPPGTFIPAKENNTSKGIDISPSVGWFLSNKFEMGIQGGYVQQHSVYTIDSSFNWSRKSSGVRLQLYGNNYFPLNEKAYFILTSYVNYQYNISENLTQYAGQDYYTVNEKSHAYTLGFSPGIAFFPIKRLQLSASVGNLYAGWSITHDKNTNEISDKGWNYGLHLDLTTIVFGIHYIL